MLELDAQTTRADKLKLALERLEELIALLRLVRLRFSRRLFGTRDDSPSRSQSQKLSAPRSSRASPAAATTTSARRTSRHSYTSTPMLSCATTRARQQAGPTTLRCPLRHTTTALRQLRTCRPRSTYTPMTPTARSPTTAKAAPRRAASSPHAPTRAAPARATPTRAGPTSGGSPRCFRSTRPSSSTNRRASRSSPARRQRASRRPSRANRAASSPSTAARLPSASRPSPPGAHTRPVCSKATSCATPPVARSAKKRGVRRV